MARIATLLARFFLLFLGCCGCCTFALFNELLDFLAAFLADLLVEVRAVAVASCFAALLAALLADLLVEGVAVCLLRGLAALASDLLVEFRAVLFLDGFSAFLARFPDRHAAGFLRCRAVRCVHGLTLLPQFLAPPQKDGNLMLHILER